MPKQLYASEQGIINDLKGTLLKDLAHEFATLIGERLKNERDLVDQLYKRIGLPLNQGLKVDVGSLTFGKAIELLLK